MLTGGYRHLSKSTNRIPKSYFNAPRTKIESTEKIQNNPIKQIFKHIQRARIDLHRKNAELHEQNQKRYSTTKLQYINHKLRLRFKDRGQIMRIAQLDQKTCR